MSAYSAQVLADSPDVYFRLDETGAGPFVDIANAHNATPDGTIVTDTSLLVTDADASARFNPGGTLTKATTSYILQAQPFTIEFWVKPASLTGSSGGASIVVSGEGAGGTSGWQVAYVDATGVWRLLLDGEAFHSFGSGVKAQIGVTQHVVFVTGASQVELFINAASQGTSACGSLVGPGGFLVIGGQVLGLAARANATIDEVAVYKSALDSSRIAAHYLAATQNTGHGSLLLTGVG